MNKKAHRNIWIINHFASLPDTPGGTRHYDFGIELAKRGYEVTIFASDFNYMLRERINQRECCIYPKNKEFFENPPNPLYKGECADTYKGECVDTYKGKCVDTYNGECVDTYKGEHVDICMGENGGSPDHGCVKFVWIRSLGYKKNNWRRAANMLSFAFKVTAAGLMRGRPSVVIGSSPHLFAALSAYILAKAKGSKFFLEVRDLWPQVLIEMEAGARPISGFHSLAFRFLVMILRGIEALLYKVADRIIVLSEGSKRYIAQRGIELGKVSLITNGVYLEEFKITESRTLVREKLGLDGKFAVMYTGAHGPANALETLIDAANLMQTPDIQNPVSHNERAARSTVNERAARSTIEVVFVLIGDGSSKDKLQKMAEKLSNVKMLPAVPKRQIPDLLNAADALVITLRSVDLFSYGVSPNKLFEYMASGKPILCAINGEVADLVTHANAGVAVEPEDPAALAQTILSLVNDREKCSIYGINGRKFVEDNFSRSRIVERLVSMLN